MNLAQTRTDSSSFEMGGPTRSQHIASRHLVCHEARQLGSYVYRVSLVAQKQIHLSYEFSTTKLKGLVTVMITLRCLLAPRN